ncbi:MAG: DUF202 domain-containing protein [Deltaproteobacteria bacterium]|nr:DUF202 domain-containing protein [Deltaproteobacteria bacterium]
MENYEARSAGAQEESHKIMENSDELRTYFAAERTHLAWIRTGLALMGFGFVVARFGLFLRELSALGPLPHQSLRGASLWIGVLLVGMGVLVNVVTAREHFVWIKAFKAQKSFRANSFGIGLALGLAILGIAMIAYLIFLQPRF